MTDDDIWNLKVELVKLGNQGKYQEQIDFMLKNKNNLDYQFCSMFVMSFQSGKIRSLCFRYDKPFDNREREILEKNNFEFIKHNIANALVNKFIEDDFLQIKDKDDYYECEIDFL